jgi:hypothetical protein
VTTRKPVMVLSVVARLSSVTLNKSVNAIMQPSENQGLEAA